MPLLIRAPWLGAVASGVKRDVPVELVDVFPTIAELAGVPLPPGETLDGQSLAGVMRGSTAPLPRNYSLSVYPRCPANTTDNALFWKDNDCVQVERTAFFAMGVSIRTERWRYNEWLQWDPVALAPAWDAPNYGAELYDHLGDDGSTFDAPYEVVNLAIQPAYAALRATLSTLLRVAYGNAPPP